MPANVRPTGAWQHTLDIEIPSAEIEQGLDQVARRVQRKVALAGFRIGKAPLAMVRQHYAETIEREFLEQAVPRATSEAVAEAGLRPVVPPLVRNLTFQPGEPMTFEAVVEVRPEVQVKDHRGISVIRPVRMVDEARVDEVIQRLRDDAAVYLDVDRPAQRGDVVLADSVRIDANNRKITSSRARNLRLELGAPDMMPALEEGLTGAEAGQERTITIEYPADHTASELAGQTARYLVRVRKIQEKKLREMDDTLAEVFKLGTLDALRARVRENLEHEEETRTRREVEDSIVGALIQRNPFDIPARLLEWTLERMVREAVRGREIDEALYAQLAERYRPAVDRSLRREVLLGAVAAQESLGTTVDDVKAEIDRMVQADPRQAARVRARYQGAEERQALADALLERKAMEWLIGEAAVRDEVVGGRVIPAGA